MTPLATPPIPALVTAIQQALPATPVYLVGGWVRAYFTGAMAEKLAKTDLDLTVALPPEALADALTEAGQSFTDEGLRWGTLKVLNPDTTLPPVEVTSFREDAYLPGSRYPQVTFLTGADALATDARRRDFTFNAIYLALDGTPTDPFNGVSDLKDGFVRFIGEPETRLIEDPLRWLRFWRFCAVYGIAGATPEVLETLTKTAPLLNSLSKRRVADELTRLEQGPWAGNVHDLWRRHGWDFLLPT